MSATTLALLLATATSTAVGAAALHAAHGMRKDLHTLRTELAVRTEAAQVPAARAASDPEDEPARAPLAEIRTAVAEALAEERERELAEARAFWAAQEDGSDTTSPLRDLPGYDDEPVLDVAYYLPRQADFAGLEPMLNTESLRDDIDRDIFGSDAVNEDDAADDLTADAAESHPQGAVKPAESSELAAARRRHPSHPDFTPSPAVADHERTVARLAELAEAGTPLADVRPGPLGTLDVYVFADGTTVCMTPGHRETAERLAAAVRGGDAPVLLGGSGVSGAYTLTFAHGEESVYVLADRVVASL